MPFAPSSVLVTTSKALVTRSDALVPSSVLASREKGRILCNFAKLTLFALAFQLGGSYVLLNVFMDNTDWSNFAGERTLSAEDRR